MERKRGDRGMERDGWGGVQEREGEGEGRNMQQQGEVEGQKEMNNR